jgi:DNA repair exonuclease SbcCD ATPase subunit
VVSVVEAGAIDVYDMEVPGTNNFVANGMVVHNSGKSFLIDGVAWALYGRCVREKYAGDDIIRNGSTGGAGVSVDIVGGDIPIRVERYRQHKSNKNNVLLFINEENATLGTSAETTKYIEGLLGMDYLTFSNAVAFGAREDVRSFFTANDSERKKILDTLLGLEVYVRAQEQARSRMASITVEIAKAESAVTVASAKLDGLGEAHDPEAAQAEQDELEAQAAQRKKEAAEATKKAQALSAKVVSKQAQIDSFSQAYENECVEIRKAIADYRVKEKAATAKVTTAASDLAVAEREVERLKKEKAGVEKMKGQCPTCKQMIFQTEREKILKDYDTRITKAEDEVNGCQLALVSVKGAVTALGELPELPAEPAEIAPLEDQLETLRNEQRDWTATAKRKTQEAETALQSASKLAEQARTLATKRAQLETTIADNQTIIDDRTGAKEMTEFWVKAFGNSGIKSFLIEAEIPQINRAATTYVRRLLGPGAVVKISATKQLKSKDVEREELTVDGVIPGYTQSYAGASKGQKRRMDLSLLLAFRDLVARRSTKPFAQLFADEIFDGLDRSGVEAIAAMLKELAVSIPVFLVTHDRRLASYSDRHVVVAHDGEKATLRLANAAPAEYSTTERTPTRAKRKTKG